MKTFCKSFVETSFSFSVASFLNKIWYLIPSSIHSYVITWEIDTLFTKLVPLIIFLTLLANNPGNCCLNLKKLIDWKYFPISSPIRNHLNNINFCKLKFFFKPSNTPSSYLIFDTLNHLRVECNVFVISEVDCNDIYEELGWVVFLPSTIHQHEKMRDRK